VKVMAYHQNNVAKALVDCFPAIGLDPTGFLWLQSKWRDPANRRKFFEDYAKEQLFDPLIAENWYSQTKDNIMSKKGAFSVINFYKCNMANALISLFPDLGLLKSRLNF